MTLVSVFMTNCHESENAKTGPERSHVSTVKRTTAKTAGYPDASAT